METQNIYQPPKSNLLLDQDGPVGKMEVFLQKFLRFVFGTYSFFSIVFCLFGVIGLIQGVSTKSSSSMLNAIFMAYCSIMAFKSLKYGSIKTFKYAVLLLVVGFGTTAIYRLSFVTTTLDSVDLSNFLLFGIPAALTFHCSNLEKRRQKPNPPFQVTRRDKAASRP